MTATVDRQRERKPGVLAKSVFEAKAATGIWEGSPSPWTSVCREGIVLVLVPRPRPRSRSGATARGRERRTRTTAAVEFMDSKRQLFIRRILPANRGVRTARPHKDREDGLVPLRFRGTRHGFVRGILTPALSCWESIPRTKSPRVETMNRSSQRKEALHGLARRLSLLTSAAAKARFIGSPDLQCWTRIRTWNLSARASVLECGSPLPLWHRWAAAGQSARGLAQSKSRRLFRRPRRTR
jgi:hypothetical protein